MESSNKKTLAKNTLLLYVRTLLSMLISLYTSRIVLQALSIENYGIYNIVGGFVGVFSVVSATLTSSTQRYLTVELGKGNGANPIMVFNSALIMHLLLSVILLLLFETIGLWFLNTQLNIDSERMIAANWVYQFSIISFLINLISTPYNAAIIAHEKMSVFAYISLMDVILKLIIVYLLYISPIDVLIFYAFLFLCVSILDRFIYSWYCHRHFEETKFRVVKDKSLYKEMTGFAGYNFLGVLATVLSNQGVSIILNIFGGVVVNAARGISNQVLNAVSKFVNDFMTALNPQITKTCAAGNTVESISLCHKGAKFSFFLMLVFAVPLIIRAPQILELWLKSYPDYSVQFVNLTLIYSMIVVLSNPLITLVQATGKIKEYTYWVGGVRLLTLPLCYILLKWGFNPYCAYYAMIFTEVLSLALRLAILKKLLGISPWNYIKEVVVQIAIVTTISFSIAIACDKILPQTFWGLLLFAVLSVTESIIIIFCLGLKKTERQSVMIVANNKLSKLYRTKH